MALLIPSIHLVTLVITGMSALYVLRQKTTEYNQVRNLLVVVHLLYMGVVVLELLRTVFTGTTFLYVYTVSGTSFVLADVLLLTLIGLAVYYRPNGRAFLDILKEVGKHQTQATFLTLYSIYIFISGGYLAIFQPFASQVVPNVVGALQGITASSCGSPPVFGCQVATQYNSLYLDMLLGILLIFMAYPSSLLLLARARSSDEEVRSAFIILPVAWVAIGLDLLFFNGYLLNQGVDASALGYLIAAAAFSATAATFRRATLLSAFFLPSPSPASTTPPSSTFSGRLGLDPSRVLGKEFLMEVDPAVKYEDSVKDLALELGAKQYVFLAFTSKGSPVYNALSGLENVRFFTLTTRVSYPKPGELPSEVLVPANDQSMLLNVLDKGLTSNPSLKFGLVFDSVTDLILSSGLETTYKFLKQANEMASSHSVTALFLMTAGAHTEREARVVKSLFSNLITFGPGQASIVKSG